MEEDWGECEEAQALPLINPFSTNAIRSPRRGHGGGEEFC